MSRAARARIIAGVVLCVVTMAFFAWDGRFRVADPGILDDPGMTDALRHWAGTPGFVGRDREQGNAVALVAGGQPRMTHVSQSIKNPSRFSRYRVTLDIRLDGIVPRAIAWQRAGVVLRAFDAGNARLRHWPHLVMEGAGTQDWRTHSAIMPVAEDAAILWFSIYNAGSAGTMWIRNVKIEGLVETPLGVSLRYGMMAAWAVLIYSSAAGLLRHGRPLLRWGLLGLGGFILAGSLAPQPGLSHLLIDSGRQAARILDSGSALVRPAKPPSAEAPAMTEDSSPASSSDTETEAAQNPEPETDSGDPDAESQVELEPDETKQGQAETEEAITAESDTAGSSLMDWLNGILYEGRPILGLGATSFAHMVAYFSFAFLSVITLRRVALPRLIGYLVLASAATEVLQSFSVTRGVEVSDLGFNTAGLAAGFMLAALAGRMRKRVPV